MSKSVSSSSLQPAGFPAIKVGRTRLHDAIFDGSIGQIRTVLSEDHSAINQADQGGFTPMHIAVLRGRIDVVQEFLATRAADLNIPDSSGNTVLHMASLSDEPVITHLLLQDPSVNVNQENLKGDTALTQAFKKDRSAVALLLLSNPKVDINHIDSEYNTPLLWAVKNRNIPMILTLFKKRELNPNIADIYLDTPLHIAVKNNDLEIAQLLMQFDSVDVNFLDQEGYSPLFIAVLNSNSNMALSILRREDVRVHQIAYYGKTPLHDAISLDLNVVAKALLKHPATRINYQDVLGNSPLFLAVYNRNRPLVRMILEMYPDVNISSMSNQGITPIIHAQSRGDWPTVQFLSRRFHERFSFNNKKKLLSAVKEFNSATLEKYLSHKIPLGHILEAIKLARREKNLQSLRRLIAYNTEEQIISGSLSLSKLMDSPSRYPLLDNMIRFSINKGASGKRNIVLMTQPKSDPNQSFSLFTEENYRLLFNSSHDYVIVPHDIHSINGAIARYKDKISVIILRAHGDRYRAGCYEGFNICAIRNIHFEKTKGAQIVLDSCTTGMRLARQISVLTGFEVFAPKVCHQNLRLLFNARQKITDVHFYWGHLIVEKERIHLNKSALDLFTKDGVMYLKPAKY